MLRIAIVFVLLLACSSQPPATDTAATPEPEPAPTTATPEPEPEPAPTTAAPEPAPSEPKAEGSDCNAGSECASGVCEGEGCDVPGKCMPASRGCTKDLREYCGCDGKTFSGSGSCPGARFSKRGAC